MGPIKSRQVSVKSGLEQKPNGFSRRGSEAHTPRVFSSEHSRFESWPWNNFYSAKAFEPNVKP